MPACTTCTDVPGGMHPQSTKCQDCLRKEIEEIMVRVWADIERYRQNTELYDQEIKECLKTVEQDMECIEDLLQIIEPFCEDIEDLYDSVDSLQAAIDSLYDTVYPEQDTFSEKRTVDEIISDAEKYSTKGRAPDRIHDIERY